MLPATTHRAGVPEPPVRQDAVVTARRADAPHVRASGQSA